MKISHKKMLISSIFLLMFIGGTILIFNVPFSIKITYSLTTKTEDGTLIAFNVFEPRTDGIKKAVIIGHGIMASKEFLKGYAIELANAGFIVVALDFRGHGQSWNSLDTELLVNDVRAIKQYLNNRADVDIHNLTYIGYSMGGYPGWQIVKNDTDFKCIIGIGTGFPNHDYLPECIIPANSGRKLNVLMIQALFDEGVPLSHLKEGLALRLNISYSDVELNQIYGSFKDGNATMIFLDDNSDHVLLCWDESFIRIARDWVINSFPDVKSQDENFYVNYRFLFLLLQVIGGFGFFFMILNPLSKLILKPKSEYKHKIDLPDESIGSLSKKYIIYSLILGIIGMAIMSPVAIFLPLTIAGAILLLLFGQSFATLILMKRLGKKNDLSLMKILKEPFKEPKNNLIREICLGVILTTILYIIIYLSFGLNYVGFIPSLYKLPWIPIYYTIGIFLMIIFNVFFQFIVQQKIKNGLMQQLKLILIIFGLIMSYICIFLLIACLIVGWFALLIVLHIITPVAFLISTLSVVLYEKTGNIIVSTITNTTIIISFAATMSPFLFLLVSPLINLSF